MADKLIPLTLKQHQQILYDILYMVDDFCKAHDIPYFLVGGTLLGAVRHKGIIPWDDDIDIAMTRESYERFIDLFHKEGAEGYELFDFEHKDGYWMFFAKMTKKDSYTSLWETNRIYIDVFAYDGCDDELTKAQRYFNKSKKKIDKFRFNYCISYKRIRRFWSWKWKCYYFVSRFPFIMLIDYIMLLFPELRKKRMRKVYAGCSRYSVYDKKYSANLICGLYGKGEVQPSSSFIVLDKMQFGTRELPVPSGWHDYLTGLYGDYMKMPSEEEQKRHLVEPSYISK